MSADNLSILLVHEYYRTSSPSGEDKVFEREKALLEQKGVRVETLIFENDYIGTRKGPSLLRTALYTPWSPTGRRLVRRAIDELHPDLVHFHNTFPVISQSAIVQASKMSIPTVQTFHNFRAFCAQGMLMLANGICEKCLARYPWAALNYRCYRGLVSATLPLFLNIALHRLLRTWENHVDRFIVLSDFNKKKFIQAGFPANKLRVKPNFFNPSVACTCDKSLHDWVFVGRLSSEKGVKLLPEVWQKLDRDAPVLHIVGDGPERTTLQQRIGQLGLDNKMILHGKCAPQRVDYILAKSSLLIFPSIWYEGFPLVIGEAYAAGVPVAAANIGTPAHIVREGITGVHFQPGNADDMVYQLRLLRNNPERLQEMGINARIEYENKYTPEINYRIVREIYKEAIESKHGLRARR
jgi:glycosyltransferase involved in cell wall biosynthesis